MNKSTSAIVSVYNSSQWLENRLNNLLESDLGNDLQIICVNANSPDPKDHEILENYSKHERIKYIKLNERITVYAAWNLAIKESLSKYVTNANSDDIVAPNCYSKLVNALESCGKEYSFAYCSWYATDVPNQQWGNKHSIDPNNPGYYAGKIENGTVGHFPLWRRCLHTKYGYFDESLKALGDAEWWARCFYIGKQKFCWVSEYLGIYLWRHGENLWNKEITAEEWGKYHGLIQAYQRGRTVLT